LQKAAESRSGTFPQITFNELSAISLALPIEPDLINFYAKNFLVNYFDQFFKLNDQSITLTSLRDTLLPKLISGELRIPEAEKLVEEAEL
jgi:type I restriction enzyme S subunit